MILTEQIITIAIASITTMLTRFLPFLIFPANKPTPKFIQYLGKTLPPAILGMLVIYCYKGAILNIDLGTGLALISGALTVIVHLWKRNMMISIATGTISYIILVNFIH